MRSAKEIYWIYLQKYGATNVGDILIPVDGTYLSIEDVPNAYIEARFGCNREEFYEMIFSEVESSELEDSLDDI